MAKAAEGLGGEAGQAVCIRKCRMHVSLEFVPLSSADLSQHDYAKFAIQQGQIGPLAMCESPERYKQSNVQYGHVVRIAESQLSCQCCQRKTAPFPIFNN